MTKYRVLKYEAETQGWVVIAVREARSARSALDGATDGGGQYVAVPDRSWKPLTVAVEQVTKITIA